MSESGPAFAPDLPGAEGINPGLVIAALRERGAHRFDPVRFCFIEALGRRSVAQPGGVRQVLDGKLSRALAAYHTQYEQAQTQAGITLKHLVGRFPDAADAAHRLVVSGDFRGLHRLAAQLEGPGGQGSPASLAGLVHQLDRLELAAGEGGSAESGAAMVGGVVGGGVVGGGIGAPAELKALRYFRGTWSQLSVDRQMAQSWARVPENAGPLNSQLLVLRSLKLMRDVSPAYLKRFMSYVDALLWLDQAGGGAPPQGKLAGGERDKKRKPARGKPGKPG